MSSALRFKSQISSNVRYLLSFESIPPSDVSASVGVAFTVPPGTFGSSDLVSDFAIGTDYDSVAYNLLSGQLYKDMGRQLIILEPAGTKHLAIYRQVQFVSGATTEGVSGSAANGYNTNIYIKTWSADGNNIFVTRTG
jgi:hypothetical protein